MPELRRGDVTIHYCDDRVEQDQRDQGAAGAALLIHGHTLDRTVWDDLVEPLTSRGLRVLRPDLRGHGLSSRPGSGYHWSHHAGDMAAVLENAGVVTGGQGGISKVTVVGFSVGGGIALELAITMPELLSSLVLVSPVMPDRPFEPAFMDSLRQVARVARSEGIEAAMAGPWLESPLLSVSLAKPGVRERAEQIVRGFPGAEYLATERDVVERDWKLPDRLPEISVPTLVIIGEREMPGFAAFAREAADSIAGARLEVIPDGGHLLPLEAGDALADLIARHIGKES